VWGEKRGAYVVLVGKPGGKRPLGRTRWRWDRVIQKLILNNLDGGRGLV